MVPIVVDDVVVSGLIIAKHTANTRRSLIYDCVLEVAQVMRPLTEEAVLSDVPSIEGEPFEFYVAWAVRKFLIVHMDHGLIAGIGISGPDNVDNSRAIASEDDPGIRAATMRWVEGAC